MNDIAQIEFESYAESVPQPARINFRLGLESMTVQERPCSLNLYRPDQFNLAHDRQNAPASHRMVDIEVERVASDAGVVAYRLLAELFAWFGFDADRMPYVDRGVRPPRIDPDQIVGRPVR